MGNLLSCLPFKKRDICTEKASRKDKRTRKGIRIDRTLNSVETIHLTKDLDLVERTSHAAGFWTLEDVEHEDRDTRYRDTSRPTGLNELANRSSVDSGIADVTNSSQVQPETEDKAWLTQQTSAVQEENLTSRKRIQDSDDCIRVSLRQEHEEYTKRTNRHRSMTRTLFNIISPPNPLQRHQIVPESNVEKAIADTDNSHGDAIQNNAEDTKFLNKMNGDATGAADKTLYDRIRTPDTSVDIVAGKTNTDESAAISKLAQYINETPNRTKKSKLLLQEFKKHDLRPILENIVGEKKAEIRDVIDTCIDAVKFDITVNHWCKNAFIDNDDSIHPEGCFSGDSSEQSSPDNRLVKLETLFENAIEEEWEELEDFCSDLILQRLDTIDY